MRTYNDCEYCGTTINSEEDNYAGALEDSCCKRCDESANKAFNSNNSSS